MTPELNYSKHCFHQVWVVIDKSPVKWTRSLAQSHQREWRKIKMQMSLVSHILVCGVKLWPVEAKTWYVLVHFLSEVTAHFFQDISLFLENIFWSETVCFYIISWFWCSGTNPGFISANGPLPYPHQLFAWFSWHWLDGVVQTRQNSKCGCNGVTYQTGKLDKLICNHVLDLKSVLSRMIESYRK